MNLKIYTKTGDDGKTSLYGGKRVEKHNLQVVAYGTVDELNSSLGVLLSHLGDAFSKDFITQIQQDLFSVGTHLAGNSRQSLDHLPKRVMAMEKQMDEMAEVLLPLKNFILPAGGKDAAFCHLARSICRRAEREVIRLSKVDNVDKRVIIYLNRLSDFLFQTARWLNREAKIRDVVWNKEMIA